MLNKVSIRVRLTLMSVAILTVCCLGLTLLLNNSAEKIVSSIDTYPATSLEEAQKDENSSEAGEEAANNGIEASPIATAARHNFRMDSILYMLFIIIGGGGLTYYVSGSALKPLKKLNQQVRNINANNLSQSLKVPTTGDEIAELTKSFNEMTDKLDHVFSLQQQFSASAAHELKTPLAILQTKVDVFRLENSHSSGEYEELISVFEKQLYRLRGLVSNLLSMTQVDYEEEKTPICLKNVLEDILGELFTVAEEKNITLSMECDNSLINGNLDSIYRAIYNLVENAIKYNVDGGSVRVTSLEEAGNWVAIRVFDTGIGLSDDCKKEVFQPFFRVDKSRSRQLGGSGLGLALVKRIVEQHGGTITVADNQPCGSVFITRFIVKK